MESSIKKQLTHVDVCEAGACVEGVADFMRDNNILRPILDTKTLLRIADEGQQEYIKTAANMDGDGDGDGNGYGTGNGNGNGLGDGDGYGNGFGNGNGNGDAYGNGIGNGDGYGDGNGNGDGYGDGDLFKPKRAA